MRMDTLKRTTLFPLMVLTISVFAIYLKETRGSRSNSQPSREQFSDSSRSSTMARPTLQPSNSANHSRSATRAQQQVGSVTSTPQSRSLRESTLAEPSNFDSAGPSLPVQKPLPTAEPNLEPSFTEPQLSAAPTTTSETQLWTDSLQAARDASRLLSDSSQLSDESLNDTGEVQRNADEIAEFRASLNRRHAYVAPLSDEYRARFVRELGAAQGLARKGALFSADHALNELLLDLARSLDGIGPNHDHERACRIGLQAMQDAVDFHRSSGATDDPDRLRLIALRHATYRAIQGEEGPSDRSAAIETYYTLALEMLVAGTGQQSLAAEAFVTLGKVHSIATTVDAAELGPFSEALPVSKSLLYHQIALVLDGDNAVASNELAVQLGRIGHWTEARNLLQASLRYRPTSQAWQNLAEAHERLGEFDYAELARREAVLLQSQSAGSNLGASPNMMTAEQPRLRPTSQPATRTARGTGVPFFTGVR